MHWRLFSFVFQTAFHIVTELSDHAQNKSYCLSQSLAQKGENEVA